MQKHGIKFLKYDLLEIAADYSVTDCRGTDVAGTPDQDAEPIGLKVKSTSSNPVGYSTLFNGQVPVFPKPKGEGRI